MDEKMRIQKFNSPDLFHRIQEDKPQDDRELEYSNDFLLSVNLTTSSTVPELDSAGDVVSTQDQDGHSPLKGKETSTTPCQNPQEMVYKEDSSPHSPGDLEMPTLVAQVPLDKLESSQDIISPSSMPDLKNSIAMNNPAECVYPEVSELPLPSSCHGQTLEANCMKSTLVVVVGHNSVDGKSPENFSEHSPSTSDYLLSYPPVEGSPVDDDRQPFSRNPIPPCKGQVLNGEHSPGFSLRDSCDVSSLEGESSRPMLSPQEPRSVGSEGVGSTVRVCDAFGGDDLDPDSPPLPEWPSIRIRPEAPGRIGQAAEGIVGNELSYSLQLPGPGTSDAGHLALQQLDFAACPRDCGFDIPNLTPFLNSSTRDDGIQDEDTCCHELPELLPEKADVVQPQEQLNACYDWSASIPSKAPLKARVALGREKKFYAQFYSDDTDNESGSDETFDPVAQPKRKKRRTSMNKRRGSQNQAACSSAVSQPSNLQMWQNETLQFYSVEAKMCQVLKKVSGGMAGVQPGSIYLYHALREIGSEVDLPSKMASLSLKEVDKTAMQASVLVQMPPKARLNLLCSAMGGILKKMNLQQLSCAISSSGTLDSKLRDLDQLLSQMISVNKWQ